MMAYNAVHANNTLALTARLQEGASCPPCPAGSSSSPSCPPLTRRAACTCWCRKPVSFSAWSTLSRIGTRDPGVGLVGALLGYETGRRAVGDSEEALAEWSPGGAPADWETLREPDSAAGS